MKINKHQNPKIRKRKLKYIREIDGDSLLKYGYEFHIDSKYELKCTESQKVLSTNYYKTKRSTPRLNCPLNQFNLMFEEF